MKKIEELYKKIKPVVAFDFPNISTNELLSKWVTVQLRTPIYKQIHFNQSENGYLCYIEPVDLRSVAYTWNPKPTTFALNLSPSGYFMAKSKYGAPSFFKPSIAEVLEYLPQYSLEKTIAFEINPYTKSVWHCAVDGYHTFLVRAFQDKAQADYALFKELREKHQ